MAQAFITTYRKHYMWPEINRRKKLKQVDTFTETLPEGDMWVISKKIGDGGEQGSDLGTALAAVKDLYRKRMWSTYQMSYCKHLMAKSTSEEEAQEDIPDNALLYHCNTLFRKKKGKVLPPLPGLRRLFGYLPPHRMYTTDTTYTEHYEALACKILEKNLLGLVDEDDEEIKSNHKQVLAKSGARTNLTKQTRKTSSKGKSQDCICCTCRTK